MRDMNLKVYDARRPSSSNRKRLRTRSPYETMRFGARFVRDLPPGSVVLLSGALGSGKTTLIRGAARALGIRTPITSPTFVLRRRYPVRRGRIRGLNHIDAYRLAGPEELRGLLDEEFLLAPNDLWFIEWGERILCSGLPPRVVQIRFVLRGPTSREIIVRVVPSSTRGRRRRHL